MEVFCPECGVCFMPHDEEYLAVCPCCEWEFHIDDDWMDFLDEADFSLVDTRGTD